MKVFVPVISHVHLCNGIQFRFIYCQTARARVKMAFAGWLFFIRRNDMHSKWISIRKMHANVRRIYKYRELSLLYVRPRVVRASDCRQQWQRTEEHMWTMLFKFRAFKFLESTKRECFALRTKCPSDMENRFLSHSSCRLVCAFHIAFFFAAIVGSYFDCYVRGEWRREGWLLAICSPWLAVLVIAPVGQPHSSHQRRRLIY